MNRIRLLPENVANQIAAGEVVERPASVVKELVENALDAEAGRITVEIGAGGRQFIRVLDDGWGMSRDDALLCLERHATSKIQVADDLRRVATMGFRGEALPSIASVSRFTLTTRERDAAIGTQLVIHGGRMVSVQEAGAPPGTGVEVRQLFFNLPARRKFLRSEETERAHIQHYLALAALAYPEVAFQFLQDQRVIWQLPAAPGNDLGQRRDTIRQRLDILHGAEECLMALDETGFWDPAGGDAGLESDGALRLRVWGFIGAPGISRATREHQHLFVNRRPVENRGLNYALLEGYHTALMKGRYPVACLFLEIDPAEVDVNIHPAKREVRFHRERAVKAMVAGAVRRALLAYHTGAGSRTAPPAQAPTAISIPASAARVTVPAGVLPPEAPGSSPAASGQPSPLPPPESQLLPAMDVAGHLRVPVEPKSVAGYPAIPPDPRVAGADYSTPSSAGLAPDAASASSPAHLESSPPLLAVPLRIVGVIGRLYVVLESDRGLVLLDQHAAHERVLYEQMLAQLESGQAPSQRLLLAETIELAPRDAWFVQKHRDVFARLGLGLSDFGERTFLLDALPPFVPAGRPREFVFEVIAELKAAGEGVNPMRLGEQVIAKTVCRHAVKAHDPLEPAELERLLEQLRRCAMPYTCPHGRPTLIEICFKELEKKFGRIQPASVAREG